MRLKGIHLAMKTGMLAAESAYDAIVSGDTSAERLRAFDDLVAKSWVRTELHPVRNVHQGFSRGLLTGLAYSGLSLLTGGRWPRRQTRVVPGPDRIQRIEEYYGRPVDPEAQAPSLRPDRVLTFDKLTSVHLSVTRPEENQVPHLLVHTEVCESICGGEDGYTCIRFCRDKVYEIVSSEAGGVRLQINASKCVHCKTCDIMDPYQVITWVPPEGGGGPQYDGM